MIHQRRAGEKNSCNWVIGHPPNRAGPVSLSSYACLQSRVQSRSPAITLPSRRLRVPSRVFVFIAGRQATAIPTMQSLLGVRLKIFRSSAFVSTRTFSKSPVDTLLASSDGSHYGHQKGGDKFGGGGVILSDGEHVLIEGRSFSYGKTTLNNNIIELRSLWSALRTATEEFEFELLVPFVDSGVVQQIVMRTDRWIDYYKKAQKYLTDPNPLPNDAQYLIAWNIIRIISKCNGKIAEVLKVQSIDNFGAHTMAGIGSRAARGGTTGISEWDLSMMERHVKGSAAQVVHVTLPDHSILKGRWFGEGIPVDKRRLEQDMNARIAELKIWRSKGEPRIIIPEWAKEDCPIIVPENRIIVPEAQIIIPEAEGKKYHPYLPMINCILSLFLVLKFLFDLLLSCMIIYCE